MNLRESMVLMMVIFLSCTNSAEPANTKPGNIKTPEAAGVAYDSTIRTAHILIALCDNKYQGIVPVPAAIGKGDDPDNNLYWGCSYGIRSYFKSSKQWNLLRKKKIDSLKMERLVFKHKTSGFYLVCDAYRGQNIKNCTIDFLNSAAGILKDTIEIDKKILGINGNSNLITYIGHNGLMDFSLAGSYTNTDSKKRDIVILACKSKKYFSSYIRSANARPLLWTSDLMCPEAYTIHDLLNVYIKNPDDVKAMNLAAAQAYSKYQKCSVKSAANLLVSGF